MPGTPKKAVKAATKAAPAKAASKPTYGIGLANKPMELDLPSGNTCLAIRPGAQGLIKEGLLDSLDQLTALVQKEHIDSKDPRKGLQSAVNAMAANPKDLMEGLEMVDKVIAFVVKEPKVWMDEYEKDGVTLKPRKPDRLYADGVDLEDKMFIFQWTVGGTADLARFREESNQLMGNIPAQQDVRL